MATDRHEFSLYITAGWANLRVHCPYDRTDTTRPCWPHHEGDDGLFSEPDPPPQDLCVYEDQVDGYDLDVLIAGVELIIPIGATVGFVDGDMRVHATYPKEGA